MSTFEELAGAKLSDAKPPVNLPAGHYECMVAGPMTPHKAKSGNIAMRFPVQIIQPGEDVDQEELANALETGKPLGERKFNMDFWMSPDAQYRFADFLRSCDLYDENLTLVQGAERLVEEKPRFTAELKYEQDQNDPSKSYPRWDRFVGPVEVPAS